MIPRLVVLVSLTAASVAHGDTARPAVVAAASAPAAAPLPAAPAAAPPAGEPDSAVEEAGDANLESTASRKGMTVAAAIGAGLTAGFGIEDSVGRGGALSLRLGRVATPRTVITFEFDGSLVLHKQAMGSPTQANTNINLLAGAQYYAGPSVWLRFGAGLGVFQARGILLEDLTVGDRTTVGPAAIAALGIDIARIKWAVFGIEAGTTAMINGGLLLGSSLKLGLAFN